MASIREPKPKLGERFEFGRNWQRFLSVLDEERIAEAGHSLKMMLEMDSLGGKAFLDVGSGSGLFSLAAIRLGAQRVHSFDYDPQSVACTRELKRRYFADAENWTIEPGNVLDVDYLRGLGQWDVMYSWGVLHHTGDMWRALGNVVPLVREGGVLFISIYNDQGLASGFWRQVKLLYNRNILLRWLVLAVFIPYLGLQGLAKAVLLRRAPHSLYRGYKKSRGMSVWHDWIDWLGGYPFQVAKPEEIFDFYRKRGFELKRLKTCGGKLGCNEFVFSKR